MMRSVWLGACVVVSLGCTTFGSGDQSGSDGGTNAGTGTTACAASHTVCQNFDNGPPGLPWNLSSLATVVSAPKPVFSSPSSLEAIIDPSRGGGSPIVSVALPAPATKHVRCAGQVNFTKVDTTGGGTLVRIVSSDNAAFVEISVLPTSLKVDSSAGGQELPSLEPNRFVEIAVEVNTAGPKGSLTYTGPDGQRPLNLPSQLVDVAFSRAEFGLQPIGSQASWTAYLDDVYCDVL
jgi:hypothetical protein